MRFEDVKVGQVITWTMPEHTYEVMYLAKNGAVLKQLFLDGFERWQPDYGFERATVIKPKIKLYQFYWHSPIKQWVSYASESKSQAEQTRNWSVKHSYSCTEIKEVTFDDPSVSP